MMLLHRLIAACLFFGLLNTVSAQSDISFDPSRGLPEFMESQGLPEFRELPPGDFLLFLERNDLSDRLRLQDLEGGLVLTDSPDQLGIGDIMNYIYETGNFLEGGGDFRGLSYSEFIEFAAPGEVTGVLLAQLGPDYEASDRVYVADDLTSQVLASVVAEARSSATNQLEFLSMRDNRRLIAAVTEMSSEIPELQLRLSDPGNAVSLYAVAVPETSYEARDQTEVRSPPPNESYWCCNVRYPANISAIGVVQRRNPPAVVRDGPAELVFSDSYSVSHSLEAAGGIKFEIIDIELGLEGKRTVSEEFRTTYSIPVGETWAIVPYDYFVRTEYEVWEAPILESGAIRFGTHRKVGDGRADVFSFRAFFVIAAKPRASPP